MHLALRYSSGHRDCPVSDMYFTAAAKSAWHPIGRRVGTLITWINKIHSRGEVRLRSADPRFSPLVNFNFLADIRDLARLTASMRSMAALAAHPQVAALLTHLSPASYSGFAKALGRQTLRNLLVTAPMAAALDLSEATRRHVFRRWVGGGATLADLLRDDDALEAYVRAKAFGQWHPCGTCRMGPVADRDSVVDPRDARVHGVEGLHVVDASVMPTVPRANLNIPTIMIAEKFAEAISRASAAGDAPRP
jgi:5-(hydroxymethyl)furfural/furfural oxidase